MIQGRFKSPISDMAEESVTFGTFFSVPPCLCGKFLKITILER